MAWSKAARTTVTGVSNSGTTDGIGTWTTGIDINALVAVPAGATGVILEVYNGSSSAQWAGVRTTGKTAAEYHADYAGRALYCILVPLPVGNTLDFYRESADVTFSIIGFTGSETVYFDVDGTRPAMPSIGTNWTNVDLGGSVPAGGIAAIVQLGTSTRYRPTGHAFALTGSSARNNSAVVPLDDARTFDARTTSGTEPVVAYLTSGFTSAFNTDAQQNTADSVYRTSPVTNPGAAFAIVTNKTAVGASGWFARENGDTFAPSLTGGAHARGFLVPLNASGEFQVAAETGYTPDIRVDGWIEVTAPSYSSITLVDPLADSGQRITAIPDLAAGDILEWRNVVGGEEEEVTIYSNGAFEATAGVTAFEVRAYDGEWSAWVTQTVASAFDVSVSIDGVEATAIANEVGTDAFSIDTHEYGTRLILVTGYDLSGNTELRIEVQRPDGVVVTYTGTIGAADDEVVDARGVTHQLQANEYLYRDWADGDLEQDGRYRARAVYVDASRELRSVQVAFTVSP